MLQPLQLQDVSTRYAAEIADLRDFLAKSGLHLETEQTLAHVAAFAREDRAFRRDLKSHVWVVLFSADRQVSHSDLLAILAVAAAGQRLAAAATDSDAHDLLRFLVETRNGFYAQSGTRSEAPLRWPAEPAIQPAISSTSGFRHDEDRPQESFAGRVQPQRANALFLETAHETEEPEPFYRRPIAWIGAAGVLAIVLLVLLFHHSSPAPNTTPAAIVSAPSGDADSQVAASKVNSPNTEQGEAIAPRTSGRAAQKLAPRTPSITASSHPRPLPAYQPDVQPAPAPVNSAARAVPPATANRAAARPSTYAPALTAASKTPAAIPKPYTLLHRPQPVPSLGVPGAPASETQPEANSETNPESQPDYATATAAHRGLVRPTSLGIMAANVTYSPAPAYPKAASAAHVQGEVKLEAEVDPDGNVISTRIISGPPLLCDAAADALQRWHYRPYLYDGKPIAMNATVVMDFSLP